MPIFSTGIGIFRRELNLFRVSTVGLPSQVIGFCLPQIYRKSTKKHGFLWFLKAAVIRCFSIFDTQKARKIGQKRERTTTKEIKALQRFTNLKSLGVKPVPVQVRLAAPEIIVKLGFFKVRFYFFVRLSANQSHFFYFFMSSAVLGLPTLLLSAIELQLDNWIFS